MSEILKTAAEIGNVFLTNVAHNWMYLVAGIILAAAVKVFVPTDKISRLFRSAPLLSIVLATAAGAFTPLCSCGTVAVILGLVASGVPWPPIVAFLVSSPLMSPSTYVLIAGSLGVQFANAQLIASIVMAVVAGLLSMWIEKISLTKPRIALAAAATNPSQCACSSDAAPVTEQCACSSSGSSSGTAASAVVRPSFSESLQWFGQEIIGQGIFILKWFLLFDLIGSALGVLVPTSLIQAVFGQDRFYSIPLAALAGVPMYVSTSAAIPLLGSLVKAGMSRGAALAFMISGPGTSVGAMTAVLAVAPKRVFWLYVGTVLMGAIVFGYAFGMLHFG